MGRNPMSRTTKAALATGAAVLLLAGAGGTFARWFDEESVASGDITSGELSLTAPTDVTWSEASLGAIPDITAFTMVPGDVVTYTATVTPVLDGDNLEATLTADVGTAAGALAPLVTVTSSVGGEADGDPLGPLTEADSGDPLDVEVEITLPLSTGGEPGDGDADTDGTNGQNATLTLEDLTLSLVQDDNP